MVKIARNIEVPREVGPDGKPKEPTIVHYKNALRSDVVQATLSLSENETKFFNETLTKQILVMHTGREAIDYLNLAIDLQNSNAYSKSKEMLRKIQEKLEWFIREVEHKTIEDAAPGKSAAA